VYDYRFMGDASLSEALMGRMKVQSFLTLPLIIKRDIYLGVCLGRFTVRLYLFYPMRPERNISIQP